MEIVDELPVTFTEFGGLVLLLATPALVVGSGWIVWTLRFRLALSWAKTLLMLGSFILLSAILSATLWILEGKIELPIHGWTTLVLALLLPSVLSVSLFAPLCIFIARRAWSAR